MGYLCATCGGVGGVFETSHAHSNKDSCVAELKAENANLRAEVERLRGEHKDAANLWLNERRRAIPIEAQRDSALLQAGAMLRVFNAARAFVGLENNGVNYHLLKANLTLAVRECEQAAEKPVEGTPVRRECDPINGKCDYHKVAVHADPPETGKRTEPSHKYNWCSNCGAEFELYPGQVAHSFPYCTFCS